MSKNVSNKTPLPSTHDSNYYFESVTGKWIFYLQLQHLITDKQTNEQKIGHVKLKKKTLCEQEYVFRRVSYDERRKLQFLWKKEGIMEF